MSVTTGDALDGVRTSFDGSAARARQFVRQCSFEGEHAHGEEYVASTYYAQFNTATKALHPECLSHGDLVALEQEAAAGRVPQVYVAPASGGAKPSRSEAVDVDASWQPPPASQAMQAAHATQHGAQPDTAVHQDADGYCATKYYDRLRRARSSQDGERAGMPNSSSLLDLQDGVEATS